MQEPRAGLRMRQGDRGAGRASRDRAHARRARARGLDASRHAGHGAGILEQRLHRDLDAEDGAHLVEQGRPAQRVAAHHEEVRATIDALQPQHGRPPPRQRGLQCAGRGTRRRVGGRRRWGDVFVRGQGGCA